MDDPLPFQSKRRAYTYVLIYKSGCSPLLTAVTLEICTYYSTVIKIWLWEFAETVAIAILLDQLKCQLVRHRHVGKDTHTNKHTHWHTHQCTYIQSHPCVYSTQRLHVRAFVLCTELSNGQIALSQVYHLRAMLQFHILNIQPTFLSVLHMAGFKDPSFI